MKFLPFETPFGTPGPECYEQFRIDHDVAGPSSPGCHVYMNGNLCNFYELSINGTEILSCKIDQDCEPINHDPKCSEFYSQV